MVNAADPSAVSSHGRRPWRAEVIATSALAIYSAVVAAGFARVFSGWGFLDDLVLVVVVVHGAGLLLRRSGVPGVLAVPAVAVAVVWTAGAMHYWGTFSFGLPSSDTLAIASDEFELVRSSFRTAVAPVTYSGGWDTIAALCVGAAALLADTFAFRAFARAEALVPGGVLFVFVAALGDERLRGTLAIALVASGVLATIALRTHHATPALDARGVPTLRIRPGFVMSSLVVTALVAATAGLVGPRVPGASAEPWYDTRTGGGGTTSVISPLVDIRSRLTNQRNVELFVVQSNAPSYWRTSALASFDGTVWGLPERPLEDAVGSLGDEPGDTSEQIRQRIRIVGLAGSLLPAAPDPVAASGTLNLRFNRDSSTLVTADAELDTGQEFDVVSAAPRFDAAQLDAATSTMQAVGDPIYVALPDDIPDVVADLAGEVTAGSSSPYQAALALQNWFRQEFTYSLEVQSGHGTNAIEVFLRDRVGYCEQFAGTYAAMMRSIGVPARVSVGFTPGREINVGAYSVIGKNAHAWPEVWFDGLGWVPFEPTPGRGAPGAEAYTGISSEQDTTAPDATDDDDDEATPAPTTVPRPADPTADRPGGLPEQLGETTVDDPTTTSATSRSNWWWPIALAVCAVAALAAPAVVRWSRRRRPAPDDAAEIERLWVRARAAAVSVGVASDPSLTPTEFADATARRFPVASRPMRSLAATVNTAVYSPQGTTGFDTVGAYGASTMRSAANWCRQIERAARDTMTRPMRIRRYFTHWT
jgi:transglutaminase-like putative cysteine protease